MKIKQYIVTYKNNYQANKAITSIHESLSAEELSMLEINVIANHSSFELTEENKNRKVNVLMNTLRPDFSTGHLARSWNQCIINGFESLVNPACDILVTCQDDTEFQPNYINKLIELHKKYSFIQLGSGDACISYTPEAVKRIGLWDERYCNIGHQEADYFFRAYLYNNEFSTINDPHGKYLNEIDVYNIIKKIPNGAERGEEYQLASKKYDYISYNLYHVKWGSQGYGRGTGEPDWRKEIPPFVNPLINSFIFYPYFEKDLYPETLKQQKYLI